MLTALQEYVIKNGYEKIGEELGISAYEHPTLPLVGFKYSQIDSPKTHPVVRASRGTVLEKGTWKLVAHPFTRFFNYGENLEELATFIWDGVVTTTKEDGSLVILYHYNNEWHMNTSGSFGLGRYNAWTTDTWRDLFWKTAEKNGLQKDKLNTELTYIFELCTLENKVVRMYPVSSVFMLSCFKAHEEMPWEFSIEEAKRIGSPLTAAHTFKSIKEVEDYLAAQEQTDLSFEGVVVRDKNNVRFKVKSKTYLALHHLNDNGNVARVDRLVQLCLSKEVDEVVTYMPELKPKIDEIKEKLEGEFQSLSEIWNKNKSIEDKKAFAMAVKDHKFSGILFHMRKKPVEEQTDRELLQMWRNGADLIVKVLYPKL